MPKKEQTPIEQINEAIEDLRKALIANHEAKLKVVEINREQTKTHFEAVKASQRLLSLQQEL